VTCPDDIARKIQRGAYHTRRRLRKARLRYHRAYHAESVPILAALGRDLMREALLRVLIARCEALE
jgi:hypothetical protein